MTLKKLFRYFLLPMLAILIIPSLTGEGPPDKAKIILAIICGLILGSIRCLWDAYQHRKQNMNI